MREKCPKVGSSYGSDPLSLVLVKSCLTKLLVDGVAKSCIGRRKSEILTSLELVVSTVSMGEAVRRQVAEV